MKSIVHFQNDQNDTLRGVCHSPDKSIFDGCKHIIIFPNGGLMSAEGDYRAHYRIANYLNEKGFHVLRFNPSGIGLSDGHIAECRQRDLFGQIETGLFVNDIKAAVNFIRSIDKFDSITLSGICGGAISSFLAASQLSEVSYVIPIGIPVVLDSDAVEYDLRMPKEEAQYILSMYFHKLLSLKSWARLLTVRSDLRKIRRAVMNIVVGKEMRYLGEKEGQGQLRPNGKFFGSLRKMAYKKKMLFIFGDSDRFWWEFKGLVLDKYNEDQNGLPFDYYLVPNGNHMLSWVEMQSEVAGKILSWLKEKIGQL